MGIEKGKWALMKDGLVILPGERLEDHNGKMWEYHSITKIPGGGSTGRIYVRSVDKGQSDVGNMRELYPSVLRCQIVEVHG